MPPPLLIIKTTERQKDNLSIAPTADNILLPAAGHASFSAFSLYIGNTAKTEKSRTKKAATPNRQAGATADTHPTLAQRSGVYGYHTTSRRQLQ